MSYDHVNSGDDMVLTITVGDGETDLTITAIVRDEITEIEVVGSPFTLTHIAKGLYKDTFPKPADGKYLVTYEVEEYGNIEGKVEVSASDADAVWDEAGSEHTTAGSFGRIVQDTKKFAGGDVDPVIAGIVSENVITAVVSDENVVDAEVKEC